MKQEIAEIIRESAADARLVYPRDVEQRAMRFVTNFVERLQPIDSNMASELAVLLINLPDVGSVS